MNGTVPPSVTTRPGLREFSITRETADPVLEGQHLIDGDSEHERSADEPLPRF
jgi:hypothetical protein